MYNEWFIRFAPGVFRHEKTRAIAALIETMRATADMTRIDSGTLLSELGILPSIRMATCPPIARDRLTGLSGATDGFVSSLDAGTLPRRMRPSEQRRQADLVAVTLDTLLDRDLFPWLRAGRTATADERAAAAAILADRLCTANADPIVRNAQEERQLAVIEGMLRPLGYRRATHSANLSLTGMPPGTYQFRMNVMGGAARTVRIPIDCVIQPRTLRPNRLPLLVEAKSAGDFTNTNKRRKEEADKYRNLLAALGSDVAYVLFLCGYFGETYLQYEVAEGIDFVWEHRPQDLMQFGL
jgi:hypothetical protein